MSEAFFRQTQDLNPDPIVELWELDTTELSNVFGETGTGDIYRWTPGILNYRLEGTLSDDKEGRSMIVLDRLVGLENTALTYTIQVGDPFGDFSPAIKILSWGIGAVAGQDVSFVVLETPIPFDPVIGAPWLIESIGTIKFGGVEYTPAPIELTGLEWSGQGKLPTPKLRVSNLGGLAAALVIQFGDIVGAKVTMRQTFKSFLDGEANADPSAIFEPNIFVVDRKSAHNKHEIEFELAAAIDQQGIRLPRRIVLRNSCDHTYRQYVTHSGGGFVYGTCPYTGSNYFKSDGSVTFLPTEDLCGKQLHDCILRFPNNALLPFRGFPGVAEVRV